MRTQPSLAMQKYIVMLINLGITKQSEDNHRRFVPVVWRKYKLNKLESVIAPVQSKLSKRWAINNSNYGQASLCFSLS